MEALASQTRQFCLVGGGMNLPFSGSQPSAVERFVNLADDFPGLHLFVQGEEGKPKDITPFDNSRKARRRR
jgi:hypothetical protein